MHFYYLDIENKPNFITLRIRRESSSVMGLAAI